MTTVDLLERFQVIIPPAIRRQLRLKPGDRIEFATQANGDVLVRNHNVSTNDDQSWFWTDEWQAGEREADSDIAAGRVSHFETGSDFINWLETH